MSDEGDWVPTVEKATALHIGPSVVTVDGTSYVPESRLVRLREGIEEYLLWRPGERGHAAAHRKLAALLKDAA